MRRLINIKGFTLLELLIVIAIALILAGITVPHLDLGLKNQKLDIDSKRLASNISLAQQYAIGQKDGHRYYGVVFYNGGYRIVPYDDQMIPLTPIVVPSSVNENGDIPFSEGITISAPANVIFNFQGSLTANCPPIALSIDSYTKTINIAQLTGSITIN